MISAIKDFDEDRHESVNMRVGIHTGTVLCGIVGKTIFLQFRNRRYTVWEFYHFSITQILREINFEDF